MVNENIIGITKIKGLEKIKKIRNIIKHAYCLLFAAYNL